MIWNYTSGRARGGRGPDPDRSRFNRDLDSGAVTVTGGGCLARASGRASGGRGRH